MEPENCRACRFWNVASAAPNHESRSGALVGQCRRRAPVVSGDRTSGRMAYEGTAFPRSSSTQWCGEYEASAERAGRDITAYRIDREAATLVSAARTAAAGEAGGDKDPDGWTVEWRMPLGRISQRISTELPDLDGDIRDRAKLLVGADEAALGLLNWAALDTAMAEITGQ